MKKEITPSINAFLTEIRNKLHQLANLESRILPTESFMQSVTGSLASQTTALDSLCYAVEQLRAETELARRYSRVSVNKRTSRASQNVPPSPPNRSPNLASMLQMPGRVPAAPDDNAPSLLNGSSSSYSRQSIEKVSMDRNSADREVPELVVASGSNPPPKSSKQRPSDALVPTGKKKPQSRTPSLQSADYKPSGPAYGMMDELEAFTAQQLMHRRGKASEAEASRSVDVGIDFRDEDAIAQKPAAGEPGPDSNEARIFGKPRAVTLKGAKDKEGMLKNCRRMSLDELRENYDAVMARLSADGSPKAARSRTNQTEPSQMRELRDNWSISTALPCISWVLLGLFGIMDFGESCCWRLFSRWAHGVFPVILVSMLVYASTLGVVEAIDTEASCFYFAGAILATISLRRCGLQSLLNGSEESLDEYAFKAGFLKDWRRLSKRRLVEMLFLLAPMIVCRGIVGILANRGAWSSMDVLALLSFAFMEIQFTLVAYVLLHICCGLELAIDSFGFRFFKEMDLEQAIDEWNMLQATLRQVSGRLSGAILLLGMSCLGPLVLLAERVLRNPDFLQANIDSAFWIAWLYPPVLQFLYTLARAASVTGRACRVAPLVNSWKFESESPVEGEDEVESGMDPGRQYVVQYIIQSEAGFYMKGVRIAASDVQKMCYYLLAFTFGLASRFF